MDNFIYSDFLYYLFGIVVLVVVFLLMKKVASCLIKSIVMLAIMAILGAVYYIYFLS